MLVKNTIDTCFKAFLQGLTITFSRMLENLSQGHLEKYTKVGCSKYRSVQKVPCYE